MKRLHELLQESDELNIKIFKLLSMQPILGNRFFYPIMECFLKVVKIDFNSHTISFSVSTDSGCYKTMDYIEFEEKIKNEELLKI